jgi:hypothetical protein
MGHIDDGLVVDVSLLAEPCAWYWQILDGRDGRLMESSWATEWVAFASRAEAAAAGASRLAELRTPASSARVTASSRRPGHRIVAAPARRAG